MAVRLPPGRDDAVDVLLWRGQGFAEAVRLVWWHRARYRRGRTRGLANHHALFGALTRSLAFDQAEDMAYALSVVADGMRLVFTRRSSRPGQVRLWLRRRRIRVQAEWARLRA